MQTLHNKRKKTTKKKHSTWRELKQNMANTENVKNENRQFLLAKGSLKSKTTVTWHARNYTEKSEWHSVTVSTTTITEPSQHKEYNNVPIATPTNQQSMPTQPTSNIFSHATTFASSQWKKTQANLIPLYGIIKWSLVTNSLQSWLNKKCLMEPIQ